MRAGERRADTILHEMAHMWFGDLVTMRWWDDLWLNESFASWRRSRAVAATRCTTRGPRSRTPEGLGLPAGSAAHDPPDRGRRHGPGGRQDQLRRHHLREGRLGTRQLVAWVGGGVPRRVAVVLRRTSTATRAAPTCSPSWSWPSPATWRPGRRSGCRRRGQHAAPPLRAGPRRPPTRSFTSGRRRPTTIPAALAPDRGRPVRPRRRGCCPPRSGSSSMSSAG